MDTEPYFMKPVRPYLSITFLCLCAAFPASGQSGVNFTEIGEMAVFADAAYRSEAEIHALFETSDYKLVLFHTIAESQVAFLLATNESTKMQIISIRGTANLENTLVNISLKLTKNPDIGVSLHKGFASSAKQIYTELKPLLIPEYNINVTGHSLGGAVALILAMYLDTDRFNVNQVVTFGQPKVTNIFGADKFKDMNIIRVVGPDDLVPLVPLFDPLDIRNPDIYWHAGKELILLDDTGYAILEGVDSMLRATKFTQKPLTEENLNNHRMSAYLQLIDARKRSAELVPYKTDFNLFNLFGSE
jgi:pimeloyl-ACP methyl ester carboxylesterase